MKIFTGKQMTRWDSLSIKRDGISAQSLMENAARACLQTLTQREGFNSQDKVVVICGPGNNGGDGFALTWMLRMQGVSVACFFLGKTSGLSPESRYFFQKLNRNYFTLETKKDFPRLRKELSKAATIVDAIFGNGLKRPVQGIFADAVNILNGSKGFKFAIDIPTGIESTSGKILGVAFRADLTVTFGAPKWGLLMPEAFDVVGRLKVVPIGLSSKALNEIKSEATWIDADEVATFLRKRPKDTNKGSAGQALVIAGSTSMPGAGYLTAYSTLKTGAGLVRWVLPEEAFRKIDLHYPEIILLPTPSQYGQFQAESLSDIVPWLEKSQSLALGPGWGMGAGPKALLERLLRAKRPPTVLDADGLNALADSPEIKKRIHGCILTPHPKELARLLKAKIKNVQNNRFTLAKSFAKKHKIWLVLKGYRSIVTSPHGELWINSTGGPNLATAGSGDVLTGVIAGLLAQGLSTRQSCLLGVYLHGLAGDILSEAWGDRGTLASDLAKVLPLAIRSTMETKRHFYA